MTNIYLMLTVDFIFIILILLLLIRTVWNIYDYISIENRILSYRNNKNQNSLDLNPMKYFYHPLEDWYSLGRYMGKRRNTDKLIFVKSTNSGGDYDFARINLVDFNLTHHDQLILMEEIQKLGPLKDK